MTNVVILEDDLPTTNRSLTMDRHLQKNHNFIICTRAGISAWSEEDRRYLALAINEEAGELAGVFKKRWRGDIMDPKKNTLRHAREELADIRAYCYLMALALGLSERDMVEEIITKCKIVAEKHGVPI